MNFAINFKFFFQPLVYLLELNSAVGGLEFMQRNINFFDSNSIFVIVLRDIKPVALRATRPNILQDTRANILQDTDPNIIEFVKSPIMERLTNSVFLVLRDASRVDIWGQVKHQHFKLRSNNPEVVIFYMRQHLWNPVGWVGNATGHSFELWKLYGPNYPKDSFHRGERLFASYLGTYDNGRFWGGEKMP